MDAQSPLATLVRELLDVDLGQVPRVDHLAAVDDLDPELRRPHVETEPDVAIDGSAVGVLENVRGSLVHRKGDPGGRWLFEARGRGEFAGHVTNEAEQSRIAGYRELAGRLPSPHEPLASLSKLETASNSEGKIL